MKSKIGLLSPYGIIDKLAHDADMQGVTISEITVNKDFFFKLVNNLGDNVVIAPDDRDWTSRKAIMISCLTNVVKVICADE